MIIDLILMFLILIFRPEPLLHPQSSVLVVRWCISIWLSDSETMQGFNTLHTSSPACRAGYIVYKNIADNAQCTASCTEETRTKDKIPQPVSCFNLQSQIWSSLIFLNWYKYLICVGFLLGSGQWAYMKLNMFENIYIFNFQNILRGGRGGERCLSNVWSDISLSV